MDWELARYLKCGDLIVIGAEPHSVEACTVRIDGCEHCFHEELVDLQARNLRTGELQSGVYSGAHGFETAKGVERRVVFTHLDAVTAHFVDATSFVPIEVPRSTFQLAGLDELLEGGETLVADAVGDVLVRFTRPV